MIEDGQPWASLPDDQLQHLFRHYLTMKNVFVCRRVCRFWKGSAEAVLRPTKKAWISGEGIKFTEHCFDEERHEISYDNLVTCSSMTEVRTFLRLCPEIEVLALCARDEMVHREVLFTLCDILVCLMDFSTRPSECLWANDPPILFPNLQHISMDVKLESFWMKRIVETPGLQPSLESITFSKGTTGNQLLTRLPVSLKYLKTPMYCPWLPIKELMKSPAMDSFQTLGPLLASELISLEGRYYPNITAIELASDSGDILNLTTIFPNLLHLTLRSTFIDKTIPRITQEMISLLPRLQSFGFGCRGFPLSSDVVNQIAPICPPILKLHLNIVQFSAGVTSPLLGSVIMNPEVQQILRNVRHLELYFEQPSSLSFQEVYDFVESHMLNGSLLSLDIRFGFYATTDDDYLELEEDDFEIIREDLVPRFAEIKIRTPYNEIVNLLSPQWVSCLCSRITFKR